MTDERLRELEQRWKASGSPEDEAAYLLEKRRHLRVRGRRRIGLCAMGALFVLISTLPWIGFDGHYFAVPGVDVELPRLPLVRSRARVPGGRALYSVATAPLSLLAATGLAFLNFPDEGPQVVRPFWVFVFWYVLGAALVSRALAPLLGDKHLPRVAQVGFLSLLSLPLGICLGALIGDVLRGAEPFPLLLVSLGFAISGAIWLAGAVALWCLLPNTQDYLLE